MHKLAYLLLCALTIALLVFLNSTQPFLLTEIYHKLSSGRTAGTLAFADEVVNIVAAPLWGALSDKIGTRHVSVAGLLIMAASIAVYPRPEHIYPGVLLARLLFALGASACVAMITAILGEYSQVSGEQLDRFDDEVPMFISDEEPAMLPKSNGTLAGMVGLFSGLGAIFAVAVFLPLPTHFDYDNHPQSALKTSYVIVAAITAAAAVVFYFTLYQHRAKSLSAWLLGRQVSIFDEAALDLPSAVLPYSEILRRGFAAARDDAKLRLAYLGSAVARSATVVLALFVPLMVNNWFYRTGRCELGGSCREGYVLAAILTGIANTAALIAAPLLGWLADRAGQSRALAASCFIGVFAMANLATIDSPKGVWPAIICVLTGIAQIGAVTVSLSMATDRRRDIAGSVAGVYSLSGGVGILLITQLGGQLADWWDKTPFVIMGALYGALGLAVYRQILIA